jgi:Flp pilus assembly protein TadG
MSVELVILAPFMLGVALFVIACGRIGLADISVQNAANAAARDASLSRTESSAQTNATTSAQDSITVSGLKCSPLTVNINGAGIDVPIGQVGTVSATVTCTLDLSDIALPGLPGTKVVTSTATSPVDPFRERK